VISPASDDRVRTTFGARGRSRRFARVAVRAVFIRLIVIALSKLNHTLTFREVEIKNAFRERFKPLLPVRFPFPDDLSKTLVFESDSGVAKFLQTV
jgi:hypothetical protein